MAYTDYNMNPATTGNYDVKTHAELGLTTNIQTTDAFKQTILGVGDKYNIDLYGSMMTWKVDETPFLTMLYNLGTESAAPPYIVWNDEYKGTSWVDIGLDEMRLVDAKSSADEPVTLPMSGFAATVAANTLAVAPDSNGYVGGSFAFGKITTDAALNALTGTYTPANISPLTTFTTLLGGTRCFTIAMKDGSNQGRVLNIHNRLRQLLHNLKYVYSEGKDGNTVTHQMYRFTAGTTYNPVYFAFDDVSFYDAAGDGAVINKQEVLIRIEAIVLNTRNPTAPELYIILNAAQSNHSLTGMEFMLTSVNHSGESAKFAGQVSHPSRMVQIGVSTTAPLGIPEGDVFAAGGNFTSYRERKDNYSQIFATPKYGITGTHAASNFRFGDDFAATREQWLSLYKGWKAAAYLTGIKEETVVNGATTNSAQMTGQPVRRLGGLLDYSLFPITYMKKPLAEIGYGSTDATVAATLSNWFNDLSNSLLAFRTSSSTKNITLLCSQKFLDKLDVYVRLAQQSPWMGGSVQMPAPSQLTFGLQIYTFKTSKGITVTFAHEPALDYMVSMPVAYHQFGRGSIDPKDCLLSIDLNNIKQVLCRPDKIEGGIQEIGQDAFLEGMRGESSFKLRFPKNHALIWCPES